MTRRVTITNLNTGYTVETKTTQQENFHIERLANGRWAVVRDETGGIVDAYDRLRHAEIRLALVQRKAI